MVLADFVIKYNLSVKNIDQRRINFLLILCWMVTRKNNQFNPYKAVQRIR